MTILICVSLYLAMAVINMMLFIVIDCSDDFELEEGAIWMAILLPPIFIIPLTIIFIRVLLINFTKHFIVKTWLTAFKRKDSEKWE